MRRTPQNASKPLQKDSVAIISYSLLLRPGCGLVIAWALGKEKRLGLETVQGKDDGRTASCRRMITVYSENFLASTKLEQFRKHAF